jgi:hypothetical protein
MNLNIFFLDFDDVVESDVIKVEEKNMFVGRRCRVHLMKRTPTLSYLFVTHSRDTVSTFFIRCTQQHHFPCA